MLDTGENSAGGRFQPKKSSSVEDLSNENRRLGFKKIFGLYFLLLPKFRAIWP